MGASAKQYETGKLGGIPKLVVAWYRKNHPWDCFYCGVHLELGQRTKDHIVPRCAGKFVIISDNTVSCCKSCNGLKGHNQVGNFRQHRGPLFWGEQKYLESDHYVKQKSSFKEQNGKR